MDKLPIMEVGDSPPRLPTLDEHHELCKAMCTNDGQSFEEASEILARARTAVFDRFVSDSPGYVGRVFFILAPGGPELSAVFIEKFQADYSGQLDLCKLEQQL